ncbi:hypothetical protein [Xanthomonas translucens]|uniref:hypothetical protein n=1 Tax=Xanthomonas campestris pv. translucens TaxID=343 RepID=UPI0012D7DED1|nr:hypothetical protein [Xanthomonas translucens]
MGGQACSGRADPTSLNAPAGDGSRRRSRGNSTTALRRSCAANGRQQRQHRVRDQAFALQVAQGLGGMRCATSIAALAP